MSVINFDESIILIDLEKKTKEDVLREMGENLAKKGLVKESFIDAVIAREVEFATGLPTKGVSVAIPHTDVEHVNTKTISVATLKDPVDFGVMGDPEDTTPVGIVFMLAMDQAHDQLSLLQRLMQIFQNEEILAYLANEKSKTNIKNLLAEKLDFALEGGEQQCLKRNRS
ncbi:PTS sugar transporter subunit IIA [Aquibacillus sp. 3ASR75-11]|uniref:PTS sugar transporter subunit IIA n=1 Tax=Terrihalobacillus insolitus TaxID=2950438 RepID=A0A9X3WQI0_9BACI|nr:PTS sugar transporter subunit IIA [Terrihalobacillus insolitus]MDC3411923.1 PTS sugar transporter subunit IIA [Terrihalobacillus insolitus]MDC3423390.1 PTS sugar transporter subunit IIA [Terrihalobacillus insolitus]